jgi:exopolysaccharide biosynthesis WecB/TagA/CpsF family protein
MDVRGKCDAEVVLERWAHLEPAVTGAVGRIELPGPVALRSAPLEPAPAVVEIDDRLHALAAERLAGVLAGEIRQGTGGVITWLNHYSALQAARAGVPLDRFDYLGLDGILLCRLVGEEVERTSADLVLPALLEQTQGLRIALIGSTDEALRAVAAKVQAGGGHQVVLARNGYRDLPDPAELRRLLVALQVDLAVIGLGAPVQDFYALELQGAGPLVATCGGWLDQYAGGDDYYPAWAYPLRLNWLVRLAREPRRLWRRYTVDAMRAVRARATLRRYVTGVGGEPLTAARSGTAPAVRVPAA